MTANANDKTATNAQKREKIEALLRSANLADHLFRSLEALEPDLASVAEVVVASLRARIADLGGA